MAEATAGAAAAPQKLDELMLAMDVVDTLRHQEGLVEKALAEDDRDAALKKRLRQLYEGQGLAVSERILDDGIRALKESRFTYEPTPASFGRTLALFWVERAVVGKVLGAAALALVVLGGVTWWRVASAERAVEAARVELAQTLPAALDKAAAASGAAALTADARAAVAGLVASGRSALSAGDAAAARKAVAALDALRAGLEQTYALKIVSRPGERTGLYRIPEANAAARNYYLVVEAIDGNGKKLSLPITSEEDGTTKTVDKWAVRVPKATYDAVAGDKRDDGIVENDILGEKPRGALKPVYAMAVEGGAITAW